MTLRTPLQIDWICGILILATNPAFGQSDEQGRVFESKIRPILIDHDYDCHCGGPATIAQRVATKFERISGAPDAANPLVDAELNEVIDAWPELSDALKDGILAIVRAERGEGWGSHCCAR